MYIFTMQYDLRRFVSRVVVAPVVAPVVAAALTLAGASHVALAQVATATPAAFDADRRAGAEILLPLLNFQGQDEVCDSWIDVQNVGVDGCKVALVTWGEPGFCPPQAAGPLKVECSGLVRPGAAWTFAGVQIPTGSRSGQLLRLSVSVVETIVDDVAICDTYADVLCELLFFGLICDGDGYSPIIRAYRSGTTRSGDGLHPLDMRLAAGAGSLAATVTRRCPGAATPGRDATARYDGVAVNRLGDADPAQGGYVVVAPDGLDTTDGDRDDRLGVTGSSLVYVQNGGLQCAQVEVWFAARDGCGRRQLCDAATLASFETLQIVGADCGEGGREGAIWVRSTQPVAVVAERIVTDTASTVVGAPTTPNAAADPAKAAPARAGRVISAAYVVNGAVGGAGFTSQLTVANVSPTTAARIRLTLNDASGGLRAARVDWICALGSQRFDVGSMREVPPGWQGSARVEVIDGGGSEPRVALTGVVRLRTDSGSAAEQVPMATLPDRDARAVAGVWASEDTLQLGAERVGQGVGLIVLPSVQRDREGRASKIVLHNAASAPGSTWVLTALLDMNGVVGQQCDRLWSGSQTTVDLAALAYLGTPFRGAGVISAVYWEHDVFDAAGLWTGAWVDLEAVVVDGESSTGDEGYLVSSGTPVRPRDVDVNRIVAAWPALPACDSPVLAWRRPASGRTASSLGGRRPGDLDASRPSPVQRTNKDP